MVDETKNRRKEGKEKITNNRTPDFLRYYVIYPQHSRNYLMMPSSMSKLSFSCLAALETASVFIFRAHF